MDTIKGEEGAFLKVAARYPDGTVRLELHTGCGGMAAGDFRIAPATPKPRTYRDDELPDDYGGSPHPKPQAAPRLSTAEQCGPGAYSNEYD